VQYVDSAIQRPLLLAMTALEVALVAALIGFIHWRLTHFIDDSMYRMYALETALSFRRLVLEMVPVLALFAVLNLLALTLVAALWSACEKRLLQRLMSLIAKTTELDFTSDPAYAERKVLALCAAWRARERMRFAAIRDQLEQLESLMATEKPPRDLLRSTGNLRRLLP
jgi:hypothetical protein